MRRSVVPFLGLCALAHAQTVPTFPDLVYANLGGGQLALDLYLPEDRGTPYPLVVWIHGGAWSGGERYPIPAEAAGLLEHGIAVASVDYRLLRDVGLYGNHPVTFPAQIHDVKGAVRWLRSNAAQYGLDPARFGAFGRSAGGHLAALLATSGGSGALEGNTGGHLGFSSTIQAAADWFGPIDLLRLDPDATTPPGQTIWYDHHTSPASKLIGFDLPGQGIGVLRQHENDPTPPYPELVALTRAASPLTWVDVNDPPLLVAHGTEDTTVPIRQSVRIAEAYDFAGAPITWDRAVEAAHALAGPHATALELFFRQQFFGLCEVEPLCSAEAGTNVCPCGNAGGVGHGCAHSQPGNDGALLHAGGEGASTLTLQALALPIDVGCVFLQGRTAQPAMPWGDGQLCLGGPIVRLAVVISHDRAARFPDPAAGDPSIPSRSATLGDPIPAGSTRVYQVYYRSTNAAFCPAPAGSTFNTTNAVRVVWP